MGGFCLKVSFSDVPLSFIQVSSSTPVPGTCQVRTVGESGMETGLGLPVGIPNWGAPSGTCSQDL